MIFFLLLGSKLLSVFWSPISDCDEVFNYWEPLHFWLYKKGLQTWEYSPEFSIRSWAYLLIHGWPWKWISLDRIWIFYSHRMVLALFSLAVDVWVYYSIMKNVHASVAKYYLFIMIASAGHFISVSAFLPSTTAMLCTGISMAASLFQPSRGRTFATLIPLAFACIWAWPFVGVFSFPFVIEDLYSSIQRRKRLGHYLQILLVCIVVILMPLVLMDSYFYQKWIIVPWKMVVYNVLDSSRGPSLYGVESSLFYFKNLFLNFNLVFLLSLVSGLVIIIHLTVTTHSFKARHLSPIVWYYLWFGIFTLQPHKEERFMFVCYPLLCYSAALCLWSLKSFISYYSSKYVGSSFTFWILLSATIVSMSRIEILKEYNAPLQVYPSLKGQLGTLCLESEWHRFPSHFLVPETIKIGFLKHSFDGILPLYFNSTDSSTPMNDLNKEIPEQYTPMDQCTHLIAMNTTKLDGYSKIHCAPFLDAQESGLARLFWVPESWLKRHYVDYCLLVKK